VAGDLDEIEASMARRIVSKIEKALRTEGKSGKALTGEFAGLFRLRVKNYRVIYARTTEGYLVLASVTETPFTEKAGQAYRPFLASRRSRCDPSAVALAKADHVAIHTDTICPTAGSTMPA